VITQIAEPSEEQVATAADTLTVKIGNTTMTVRDVSQHGPRPDGGGDGV